MSVVVKVVVVREVVVTNKKRKRGRGERERNRERGQKRTKFANCDEQVDVGP